MIRAAVRWTLLVCLAVPVAAQDQAVQFEVVSIKRNTSGATASSLRPEPNGVTGINVAAMRLFRVAYQVPDFQVVDVPGWFTTERFDVVARTDRPVAIAELQGMIRTLLAERFGLQVTRAQRAISGYELRVERPGAAGLRVTDTACSVARADEPRAAGSLAPCFQAIAGDVTARGVTLVMAAQEMQGYVGQPVVDRTGLDGLYDYELRWQPDTAAGQQAPTDSNLPSLFTAVREQLGLRLVPAKPMVDVYVITAAQRPSEN